MTLAHIDPARPSLPAVPERVLLRDQLELWRDVAQLAEHLASTEFVPAAFRNKPAAVTAAILRANELGVSPMQGLAHIHVINGRPGLSAELQRALVLAAGHEVWTEEYTATKVTLCGQRAGRDHVEKVTWTMDDANRAKLAGKDTWRSYPRAMMLARCTGELCRMLFADVVAGMGYTVEELADIDEGDPLPPGDIPATAELEAPKAETRRATRTSAKRAAPRKAGPRLASAVPADAPPLPGDDGYDQIVDTSATEDPDALVAKRAQQIAIRANGAGVDHHLVVAAVTNGEKSSAKDVTADEASQVIDAIKGIADGRLALDETGDTPTIIEAEAPDAGAVLDWGADEWRAFGATLDLTPSKLLVQARSIAAGLGAEQPKQLSEIAGNDALAEALHSWALSGGSDG